MDFLAQVWDTTLKIFPPAILILVAWFISRLIYDGPVYTLDDRGDTFNHVKHRRTMDL